jgi:hypothetical protein
MNYISLVGIIASPPATFCIGKDLTYTSFRMWVHGSYLDSKGDPYTYDEQHTIICLNTLAQFIRTIPEGESIEVVGELRSRTHVLRVGGSIEVEIAYPLSEVLANAIRFNQRLVARTAIDDELIALYKPEPA